MGSNIFEDEHDENQSCNVQQSEDFDVEYLEQECPSLHEEEDPAEILIKRSEKNIKKKQTPSSNKQEALYEEILKGRGERLNIMRQMVEKDNSRVQKDDVELFFESVASSVKKLPATSIAKAKLEVLKVVTRIELEVLNNQSSSCPTQYSWTPTPSPTTPVAFNFSDFENTEPEDSASSYCCISLPPNMKFIESTQISESNETEFKN